MTSSVNQSSVTNQTAVDDLTRCDEVDTSAHPFFMAVYSLVFLVGVSLNGFIIKFYFCRAQRQASSSIKVYLKNLAAADFLLCLCLPIRITKYVSPTRLVFCKFGFSAFFLNMYASILFMGYIAANRYLKIVHGTAAPHILQTVRAAHIISTVTWVFLLALMSTYIIMFFHSLKHLTSVRISCKALHSDQLAVLYKIIDTFSTVKFLFVLVSLIFFYYNTSRRVSEARKRQPTSSSSKKLEKSHRNMLVLVCVFCFCFVPFHLFRLSDIFLWKNCSMRMVSYYLMEVTVMISTLNVCLDPLIYFIFCKSFRAQVSRRVVARN
ncbi:P2Y purinoceptor 14-like [Pagrus major]|uniref:P2Y purinoceptor 14-like n=1 Tax=Pagrus major TaxID=143350 RepID=UPI003CC8AE95